jgi:hypothetical protein
MSDEVYFYALFGFCTGAYIIITGHQYLDDADGLEEKKRPNSQQKTEESSCCERGFNFSLFVLNVIFTFSTTAIWILAAARPFVSQIHGLDITPLSSYYALVALILANLHGCVLTIVYLASKANVWKVDVPYWSQWTAAGYLAANLMLKIGYDGHQLSMTMSESLLWPLFALDIVSIGMLMVTVGIQMWYLTTKNGASFQTMANKALPADPTTRSFIDSSLLKSPFFMKIYAFKIFQRFDPTLILAWAAIQAFTGLTYFRDVQRVGAFIVVTVMVPMLFGTQYWVHMQIICEQAFWVAYWIIPTIGASTSDKLEYSLARNTTLTLQDINASTWLFQLFSVTCLPVYWLATAIQNWRNRETMNRNRPNGKIYD